MRPVVTAVAPQRPLASGTAGRAVRGGRSTAGALWLLDAAGAVAFAWGLAASIANFAEGGEVSIAGLAALAGGGILRAVAPALAMGRAARSASTTVAPLREGLYRTLLGGGLARAPSIGRSATLAVDHLEAVEAYEARFAPLRAAAAAGPVAIAAAIALASPVSAAILLATLLPFTLAMILAGSAARRASERQLDSLGLLSDLFVDRIRTLPIIRHFRAEERIGRQVDAATREVAERTVAVLRIAFLSSAALEFFSALSVALVAVYCGFSLLGLLPFAPPETLTLREAFFALALAPEFYLPMRRLAAAYHEKQLGDAARLQIATVAPLARQTGASRFDGLEVTDLVIAWPARRIGPVSFSVGRCGLTVLTGPSGSGKTSILSAVAGQTGLDAGAVTLVRPRDIAWAAQKPLILPGSLRDNLALGRPDASQDDLRDAAAMVGLEPLMRTRGAGLDLPLDHQGSGLSGGERRRLGLARALVADRALLLCDEPTADLDDASAEAIVALLREIAKRRAVVVATHDDRLVRVADGIVRL